MIFKKACKILLATFLALCMICVAMPVQAKVSASEAERLGKDLTPMGAERAGNAEGTIPEWTGGITEIPKNVNYKPEMHWTLPDPFPDDKVLFTITRQNYTKYADQLTPGLKAMFKKWPKFKMNVYKTRRTAAFPQWIYDNTKLNAVQTELVGDDGADGFINGHGGVPFPISTSGCEIQNNHVNRYRGKAHVVDSQTFTVYADGSKVSGGASRITYTFPYFRQSRDEFIANEDQGFSWKLFVTFIAPPRRKGEVLLGYARINFSKFIAMAWQYLPGQRRVRRAPGIGYDTPNPSYMGLGCYDQSFVWASRPDRYTWEYKGKKEMFIPYNCYSEALTETADELLSSTGFLNPKFVRWELHRVHEVVGNLRPECRHVYGKRVFYQDEDTWIINLADNYDTRGELWRTNMILGKQYYQEPGNVSYKLGIYTFHDFQVDHFVAAGITHYSGPSFEADIPEEMMTLSHMRKVGRR